MDQDFTTTMRKAMALTRAGEVGQATRLIQQALGGRGQDSDAPAPRGDIIDATYTEVPDSETPRPSPAPRRRLRDVVAALKLRPVALRGRGPAVAPPPIPDGARFEARTHDGAFGRRDYRLYVPASLPNGAQGLILMLHGCTQDPDDFARGTGMNDQAEAHGLIVVYPRQTAVHNPQRCWNWFRPGDQRPDAGEAALLAELAREVAAEFDVPTGRIFAAGLSAGGAMAAILGSTAPGLFSAVGVHSGLPPGAAQDMIGAFAAMRGEGAPSATPIAARVIAFHGTADATVHPSNGTAVAAIPSREGRVSAKSVPRQNGARAHERTVVTAPDGTPRAELWSVDGLGHAWSGGRSGGSYTDPDGPDASAEMVRFFLHKPRRWW